VVTFEVPFAAESAVDVPPLVDVPLVPAVPPLVLAVPLLLLAVPLDELLAVLLGEVPP